MKLPLAFSLKNRASSLAEDAKLLNGYVETRGDPKKGGLATVEKRPAMDSAFELTAGTGQGIYVPNTPDGDGEPGVIIGDILTRAPTPKTKRLSFGVQPSAVALNTAISPSVTVTIRDSLGSVVNSSANVTVALSANPTGATLGGTLTQAAVAGTATFNDLTLNRSGENFTLRATSSGLNSATSSAFTIATQCVFTVQPVSTTPGATLDPIVVTIRDTAGNTDTSYNADVSVALYVGAGLGILNGLTTRLAVNGVATFSGLSIDDAGTYSLMATAADDSDTYSPAVGVSNSFLISNATHILTAADGAPAFPNRTGFQQGDYGSISPTTLAGKTIFQFYSAADQDETVFKVSESVSQDFFTSVSVAGNTLLTSAASFSPGTPTTWTWTGEPNFINQVGAIPVTIT